MDIYIPDIYQKSIHAINYDLLYSRGIRCLLIDLDNTIVPVTMKETNKKTKELFDSLKSKGFKIIIFSNSNKSRLKPFKEELDVDCWSSVHKPLSGKYKKVMQMYGFQESQIACIGDQLLTDIKGGNKMGLTTILVNPVGVKEPFTTRINRHFEKEILRKLRDNDLFAKGKYYE